MGDSAGEEHEMNESLIRVLVLGGAAFTGWILVILVRFYINAQKRRILKAPGTPNTIQDDHPIHILLFSSETCRPCFTLQKPAIQRVLTNRKNLITVQEIDAPSSPELTAKYSILTVPSTVILDNQGKPHAINYGYADEYKLLEQIDAIIGTKATAGI
jgi:hypothetical protein